MASKLNVAYFCSWQLTSSDLAVVQGIMESIRAFCVELGCEDVSDLLVKPDSVGFTTVAPNAGQHDFVLMFSPEENSWLASSFLRVHSFKEISGIMFEAAKKQGIDFVRTSFAGMEITYRRNEFGVVETEQRSAFDPG